MHKLVVSLALGIAAAAGVWRPASMPYDGAPGGPPPAWAEHDPADSLYRAARQLLADGDYRRAATLFEEIVRQYPDSEYAPDALYWKAFALQRSQYDQDLRAAVEALERQRELYPDAADRGDARQLLTRIRGRLAERGDPEAAARISAEARVACPSQDDDLKAAALNALHNMDEERALPILREVLRQRGQCSEELRRKAVFMVADQDSEESVDILLDVVRNDPSPDVRLQAIWWLSEIESDRAVGLLDSLVRTSRDEAVRERALVALAESEHSRARQVMRALLEDPSASDELKAHAVLAMGVHDENPADAPYFRRLYATTASRRLKEAVIHSVAEIGGTENIRWLLDVALRESEPIELRKRALFWAGENEEVPIAELLRLWDRTTDREMREQLLFVYGERDEREATDRLMEIARTERDLDLRKRAIFWLSEKDDPRVQQFLLEIIRQ